MAESAELTGKTRVVVVDDDPEFATVVRRWLELEGYEVRCHSTGAEFLARADAELPDVVCLDLGLPDRSGLDVLTAFRDQCPDIPVLILTADEAVPTVVHAMQHGAYDYLTKPPAKTKLVTSVARASEHARMKSRIADLESMVGGRGLAGLVGRSAAMQPVFRAIRKVAQSEVSVLVHGETGTGKELVARAIHELGARAAGPFIAVNCAAIPESLQDSELFGHERGAFTGALQTKPGRFEQAHEGTLFLDEVAELAPAAQAKLLRVLQERRFERVGGTRTIESNFRLVAATHRDLRAMVGSGGFREDLFFRIGVFELELPPLRERDDDVELLATTLLGALAKSAGVPPKALSPATLAALRAYRWPGNVRELNNVLERAIVLADGNDIEPADLPPSLVPAQRWERSRLERGDASPPVVLAASAPALGESWARSGASSRSIAGSPAETETARRDGGLAPERERPAFDGEDRGTLPHPSASLRDAVRAARDVHASRDDRDVSDVEGLEDHGSGEDGLEDEAALVAAARSAAGGRAAAGDGPPREMTLDELEEWAIKTALERTNGNLAEVMRRLGVSRTTLYRKLKRYGVK